MAKRSQRRAVRYEKDQSGCMWGLISIFDFRHGRSTRKLIADRRHGSKHAIGTGISKNKFEILSDLEENNQGTIDGEGSKTAIVTADVSKPSVKKLMEEEMVNEQGTKKEMRVAVVELQQSESAYEGEIKTDQKRTKKTRKKSRDMDNHILNVAENVQSECSCKQNADQRSLKDLGLDEIMEEFCHHIHQKGLNCMKEGLNGEAPELSGQKNSDLEEKLKGAIKEFLIQKFSNGKHLKEDQKYYHTRELMDELQLINSDEELFLKLVQDPQSLLVKYVQSLQDSQAGKDEESKRVDGSDFLEKKLVNLRKSEDLVNHKHRSFFRRKVKSQEKNQLKANECPDVLNRIVILKPGPAGLRNSNNEISLAPSQESHNIIIQKDPSDRVGSHFFLSEIKRKWKQAMGKQQHEMSRMGISSRSSNEHQSKADKEKGIGKGNVGRNSPTKDHFYIERIAKPSSGSKRVEKFNKMKDSEISKHESDGFPGERISNIYIEAKKHLSELLSNGDGMDLSNRQNPKTLGRILSLPEYSLSPGGSPGRDWGNSFVTAQMRFSAQDKSQKINETRSSSKAENNVSPLGREAQNLECRSPIADNSPDHKVQAPNSNPSISDDIVHEIEVEDTVNSIKDEMIRQDLVKEESIILDNAFEPSGSSSARADQNGDMPLIYDDKSNHVCLKQDSHEENQEQSSPPGSPSSSLTTSKVADLEIAIDIPERPSPVSVLEPLFGEDDISPANSLSEPVKLTIQPLRIQFEEPNSPRTDEAHGGKRCMEHNKSIFRYVKAVMQASGLNWDEVCVKLLSSDQLLEPSLVDEVEFFSNQLCCDKKLLFDCINEILVEVYRYYGCSPWVSFAKPSIRPIPDMKNAILEVSKGVYWHLLQPPLPRTLDQIIRKDMARTGTWLDLQFDTETIGFDMGEAILEDLVEDTIFSYVNESSDSEDGVLPELKENEGTVNL